MLLYATHLHTYIHTYIRLTCILQLLKSYTLKNVNQITSCQSSSKQASDSWREGCCMSCLSAVRRMRAVSDFSPAEVSYEFPAVTYDMKDSQALKTCSNYSQKFSFAACPPQVTPQKKAAEIKKNNERVLQQTNGKEGQQWFCTSNVLSISQLFCLVSECFTLPRPSQVYTNIAHLLSLMDTVLARTCKQSDMYFPSRMSSQHFFSQSNQQHGKSHTALARCTILSWKTRKFRNEKQGTNTLNTICTLCTGSLCFTQCPLSLLPRLFHYSHISFTTPTSLSLRPHHSVLLFQPTCTAC